MQVHNTGGDIEWDSAKDDRGRVVETRIQITSVDLHDA